MNGMKSPQTMGELVVPEDLKLITSEHLDFGDNTFLIYDSTSDEPSAERILIFASYSMRQRAALARELYAVGTYRAVSNILATLYTIHTTIDNVSYPIFILMPDERSQTFTRHRMLWDLHNCLSILLSRDLFCQLRFQPL